MVHARPCGPDKHQVWSIKALLKITGRECKCLLCSVAKIEAIQSALSEIKVLPYTPISVWQPTKSPNTLNRVPSRRLEDRIRELCSNVTAAPKTELHTAIAKLEAALREYTLRIENKAIKDLLYGLGKPDRRER